MRHLAQPQPELTAGPGAGDTGRERSVRETLIAAAWYAVLAGLVLAPLARDGYALLLDWTPTPRVPVRVEGALGVHDLPVTAILRALSVVAPVWVLQRLILFGALAGAGFAAHLTAPAAAPHARLLAGTLFMINPFTFSRLVAGHWRILIAYALVPLAARALMRLAGSPDRRTAFRAGAWVAALAVFSAHALLVGALGIVFLVCAAVDRRHRRGAAVGAAVFVTTVAGLSSWWLVPAALTPVPPGAGTETLDAFASSSVDGVPAPISVMGLRGFWLDRLNPTGPPWWPFVGVGLLVLASIGAARLARRGRAPQAASLLAATLGALAFAIGIAWSPLEPAARWAYDSLPGLLGLREPHKALMIAALGYAWLGAAAVDGSLPRSAAARMAVVGTAALAPLASTPSMLAGAEGALEPASYPQSWVRAQTLLQSRAGPVLALPWRLYHPLPFTASTVPVASPVRDYFSSARMVASEDPLLGTGSPHTDAVRRRVDAALAHPGRHRLRAVLDEAGIRTVLIVPTDPTVGPATYGLEGLPVLLRTPEIIVVAVDG